MAGPGISVIIPTYNGGRFIADTIHSVLAQTYPAQEIIVVVDGSTDQTCAILRQFGHRIRVLEQDNGGVSSARNAGMRIACGDYIAFLDDDDHWRPDKLQRYVQALPLAERAQAHFLFSNFKRKDFLTAREYPQTNTDLNPYLFDYTSLLSKQDAIHLLNRDQAFSLLLRGYPIYPSTIMVARALLEGVLWPQDFKLSEDLLFSLRLSQKTAFIYIDEIMTTIHRHDKNASAYLLSMLESDTRVLQRACREPIFSAEQKSRIRRALGRRFCGLGWHYRQERKRGAALNAYRRSFPYPGARIKAMKGILATSLPDISGLIQSGTDIKPPNS